MPDEYDYSVLYGPGQIIAFGRRFDIYLCEDCNNNNDSYCNLGKSFEVPEELTDNEDEAKIYMAGSIDFKVKEIEVFQVKFI
jgi:hypothetical protein